MDIMVTHVYDKYRFAYYMEAKFKMNKMAAITMANDINHGYAVKLCDLPECDVKYLQKTGYHCNYENPGICNLKILNNNMKNKPSIPPYCDNERKSCIDISPQPGDELKQEPLSLFHVKFTKVVHYDEMLNERQIQALLKDNHVKSINIEKNETSI